MTMLVVTRRGLVAEDWVESIEKRDQLMFEADKLVNTALDNGLDAAPFRQYRQALRDIPQTFTDATEIIWPQKPTLEQI
ncbi:phage tail assembly chaperone [Vibrio sp.]|uniref:phage tail assembly chaperone n=1 Tax=Vibrio sp. TaxID=678 RepID=UPI00311E1E63